MHPSSRRVLYAVAALAAAVPAQSLTVNGQTGFSWLPLAAPAVMQMTGLPGRPHYWVFDIAPGPVVHAGVSIPVGLTPFLIDVGQGQPMPPSGARSIVVAATLPSLTGQTFYSAGAYEDPGTPAGFTVTNGVSFRWFAPGTSAGADAATLINEPVTLDGSGNRDPLTGQLPTGTQLQWTVTQAPAGSIPVLVGEQAEFPSFRADRAGLYMIELQSLGPAGFGFDIVEVAVYDLRFNAPPGGHFAAGSVYLNGTILGPPWSAFDVAGATPSVIAGQWFRGFVTPVPPMDTFTARVTASGGASVSVSLPVTVGAAATLGPSSPQASVERLRAAGLDGLEPQIESALSALPFNSVIQAVPTINVVNGAPAFSANVNPNSGSFNPNTVEFDWAPANGYVAVTLRLHDVVVHSTVSGVLVFVSYSDSATITAQTATLTAQMTLGSGPGGAVTVAFQNLNATLSGFSFTLGSFLNTLAQIGPIQDAIRGLVESAIEGMGPSLPGFINPTLAEFALSTNLSSAGVPLQVDFPVTGFAYDTDGVTLTNSFLATPLQLSPTAGSFTRFRTTTPPSPATFPAATPALGQPWGFALALNDDLFNHLLAQIVRTGVLDFDFTGQLGPPQTGLNLVAGVMDLLLPGTGFQWFDFNAPVTLRLRHGSAPFVVFTPGSPRHGTIHASDIRFEIEVSPAPGVFLPVIAASLSASAAVTIQVDPLSTTLSVGIDGPSVTFTGRSRRSFAGTDPEPLLANLGPAMQLLLPMLVEPLAQIPVPSTPAGAPQIVEVSGVPSSPDQLTAYFNL